MSLAIIRTEKPYSIRTAHFLHTQEDSKDCCYKLIVIRKCELLGYKVAIYYARVISAVQEALELFPDCFVEVHINEDR